MHHGICRRDEATIVVEPTCFATTLGGGSKHLNLGHVEGPPPLAPINDDSLWGVTTSTKEISFSLMKSELSLDHHILVDDNNVKSPLQWWKDHAKQFSNVAFLACQFLGIPSSQIGTRHIFSVARILTSLQQCQLGMENLDKLVMILKN
jgi:hypothetical protein